jgi:LmbE family N-acetylglucosaminyl deacetylase
MSILGVPKTDLTVLDFPACQPGEDSFFFSSAEMYRQLDKVMHRCHPTVVVTHQSTDTNQDHKFIHDLVRRVVRRRASIICGSFYYNDIPIANRQLFVELDQFQVQAKVNAVQCYESQYLGRQYLSPNAIHTQAKFYGLSAGCEYAEAFEILRMVV